MLPAQDRSDGRPRRRPLRRWLRPLVSPPVFDFWARRLSPILAWDRVLAQVVERRTEARDAVTLLLRPNRNFGGFAPGQHVNVTAAVAGVRLTRSYSFTGIPRRDGLLSITVRRVAGGRFSHALCGARVGDVLELGQAFGGMALPGQEPLLFLAAGSGITPLMSLTRALAACGMPADLTLIYWARTRAERCFAAELQALAARYPRFHVHFVLTGELTLLAGETSGRICAPLLAALVPDLAQRQVLACGPAGFVETARTFAAPHARGFQAEAFTPPPAVATDPGTVQVHLAASGRTLALPAGQPLLAALEAHGVHPPSGCRMGICNTCACGKRAGTTRDLRSGESQAEPDPALRLCISAAATDLTLDL